jgi:hypothetical protein
MHAVNLHFAMAAPNGGDALKTTIYSSPDNKLYYQSQSRSIAEALKALAERKRLAQMGKKNAYARRTLLFPF